MVPGGRWWVVDLLSLGIILDLNKAFWKLPDGMHRVYISGPPFHHVALESHAPVCLTSMVLIPPCLGKRLTLETVYNTWSSFHWYWELKMTKETVYLCVGFDPMSAMDNLRKEMWDASFTGLSFLDTTSNGNIYSTSKSPFLLGESGVYANNRWLRCEEMVLCEQVMYMARRRLGNSYLLLIMIGLGQFLHECWSCVKTNIYTSLLGLCSGLDVVT
jgi:hypothetical protein